MTDDASLRHFSRAVDLSLALEPDVVCLTGDFVTRRERIVPGYHDVLRRLSAKAPCFASLGNHDGGAWSGRFGGDASSRAVRTLLRGSGITCLHNASTELSFGDARVSLVGLGDLWNGECHPHAVFAHLAPPSPAPVRVVMSHNPDSKSVLLPYAWDLLLSGHTHGGQIGLPLLARRFAPVVDKRFIQGLHVWENRRLHISRGVGCLLGVRFNCPPEITLLTIV